MRKLFLFLLAAACGIFAYALLEAEDATRPAAAGGDGSAGDEPDADAEPAACAATTKSGRPCSRPAEPGSNLCWQHGG